MNEALIYEILSAVEEVPFGSVATYGQIARLIGRDKNARLVGKVNGVGEKRTICEKAALQELSCSP